MNEITEKYLNSLFSTLENSGKKYDLEKIKTAFDYADMLHEGQMRVSGEPYISHPVAVAEIVVGLGLDTDSVCAALLHDTVEDCSDKTDLDQIRSRFGEDVAMLVNGLTKLVAIRIEDKEEAYMENIRRMLLAMSKDIRVIFIKLCDRLHNMRTLQVKRDEKRRTTALETMHIYAPLAHRLGMQRMKQQLENLALQYLDPVGYGEVEQDIQKKYGINQNLIEHLKEYISAELTRHEIPFELKGRVKTVYSIYRKMYNQNKSFDEIYDFYAVRIIVDTELQCYTALGIIHELFKSIPGRFKDYISTPKPNLYQSLHTTVIGRDGIPFEVQIRTKEMHQIAEYGIAAHWKYKSGERAKADVDEKLKWIAKLIDAENEATDTEEFMDAFKIDIFHDEIFVFTPKGDVISLPQGSTLIDFAYSIHTAVGNKMIGAKINGMIAPIDRVPQNGDIVEILTSNATKGPSRDWLGIVKTSEARNKIRQWFKQEKKAENIVVGKEIVSNEFARFRAVASDTERDAIVETVAKRIGMNSGDDIYNALGYGGMFITKIATKLREEYDRVQKEKNPEPVVTPETLVTAPEQRHQKVKGGVLIDGEPGYEVKFAKCCNPLPGDSIIGYITRGYGVSVHKMDCPNVKSSLNDPEERNRWVKAEWNEYEPAAGAKTVYEVMMHLVVSDRISLLADISATLADMRVQIMSVNTKKSLNGTMELNMSVGCNDVGHYNMIVARLKQIRDILSITRGSPT